VLPGGSQSNYLLFLIHYYQALDQPLESETDFHKEIDYLGIYMATLCFQFGNVEVPLQPNCEKPFLEELSSLVNWYNSEKQTRSALEARLDLKFRAKEFVMKYCVGRTTNIQLAEMALVRAIELPPSSNIHVRSVKHGNGWIVEAISDEARTSPVLICQIK
jgi:hypothetical protein